MRYTNRYQYRQPVKRYRTRYKALALAIIALLANVIINTDFYSNLIIALS